MWFWHSMGSLRMAGIHGRRTAENACDAACRNDYPTASGVPYLALATKVWDCGRDIMRDYYLTN